VERFRDGVPRARFGRAADDDSLPSRLPSGRAEAKKGHDCVCVFAFDFLDPPSGRAKVCGIMVSVV